MDIRFFTFPRKRMVILLFVVLFIYGLFVFIYSELGLLNRRQYDFSNLISNLVKEEIHVKMSSSITHCPVLSIRYRNISNWEKVDCLEHQSSESGCIFASKAYAYDARKRTCSKEQTNKICEIINGEFKCSNTRCGKNEKVYINIFNNETGVVTEVAAWSKGDGELEDLVSKFAIITIKNKFKFIFLSCKNDIVQLLSLNEILFERKRSNQNDRLKKQNGRLKKQNGRLKKQIVTEKININIVMLDSLSRAHFYRSLHKTIETFKKINSNPETAEVLDFKLFQSLHGHSAQNAHGLFNASVFPINLSESEIESLPVGIQYFFKFFQSKGYETLYQDDMCWEAIWGFRQDIGGAESWEELYMKLKQGYINDTGLMFANCKIFQKFGTDHTFNLEEENYICFNGQQQNTYFLHYIKDYFTLFDRSEHRKSISYSALNAAHDYGGVRIQALDKDLSEFVTSMSQLDNTLTVILADHGNTYTDFVYIDLEGRYEMFHPSLFMIIPKRLRESFGDMKMNILRSNQNKLLTMIDLHHSFKYIADPTYHNKGIFHDISPSRKCSNLPLRFPNFCVCEGWNAVVQNSTEYVGHLEFAVGKLNNIISKASIGGMCKRLVPILFKNVLERKDGDYQITSFEVETLPGNDFESKGEKISVELKSKLSGSLPNHDMKLMSWDRVSQFGIYNGCSDVTDAKFRLCICDKGIHRNFTDIKDFYYHRTSKVYEIFKGIVKEKFDVLIVNKLAVVIRTYNEKKYDDNDKEIEPNLIAVTFEVINFTKTSKYSVVITLDGINNMKPLTPDSCSAIVETQSVMYMCTLSRKWSIWQAEYSYQITYNIL